MEPQLRCSMKTGDLCQGTRPLEEVVHRPAALVLHILEDVGAAPEGHRGIGVALSPICPDVRDPVGVIRGVKSPADVRKPFIYGPGAWAVP